MGGVAHAIRSFRCWSTYVGGGSAIRAANHDAL